MKLAKPTRKTKLQKIFSYYTLFTAFLVALVPAYLIGVATYCGQFYVHEAGHMFFGSFDNLIHGIPSEYRITAYTSCPTMEFFKIPHQVLMVEGKPSLNYALGGSIVVMVVVVFLTLITYKLTKNKIAFGFPALFLIHEIFGNNLCGTDNIRGAPLEICRTTIIGKVVPNFFYFYVALIALLFTPWISKHVMDKILRLGEYIGKVAKEKKRKH
ncbi:MAG: hypothetical protein ABIJ34_04210 [archaeon]